MSLPADPMMDRLNQTKESAMDDKLPSLGGKSFEDIKMVNEHGAEYWSARDIQPLLGYDQWRNFDGAISKVLSSCHDDEDFLA